MHKTYLLFIAICCCNNLFGQPTQKELSLNHIIQTEISSGEKHSYTLKLNKAQFAVLTLLQQGVDVVVTTYDTQGKKLQAYDSPNGSFGAEPFTISSSQAGNYTIEVAPLEPNVHGNYQLKINSIKPKAVTPSQQVDEAFSIWDNAESPGAAVSIMKNGKTLYKKGYGLANLEYAIPNSPETIFHVASVSKQFTVFSILLLAQEGKLSLDDDIRKYIPEMHDFGKKITLRHLASHTSGLRDQWELLVLAGWRIDDVITQDQILKLVYRQKTLNFEPGEEYMYCNTGFTLLAEVVSRVSGKSFAAFTDEHIFKPLQMTHTQFYDNHEKIVKNRAYCYRSESNGFKKSNLNYATVGATSLFTTADDLQKWVNNYSTVQIGSKTIFNEMTTPAKLSNGKYIECGLGQYMGEYKGMKEIQHGGGDAGYRCYETRFPEHDFSVVVLSNVAEFNPVMMSHKIVDIYFADQFEKALVKSAPSTKTISNAQPTVDLLKSYTGDYSLEPGITFMIRLLDKQFTFQSSEGQPIDLIPLSESRFLLEGSSEEIEFVQGSNTNEFDLRFENNGKIKSAAKMQAFDVNSLKLTDFVGTFYSDELATEYDFEFEKGKLIRRHYRLTDDELIRIGKDLFSYSMGYMQFERNAKGEVIGFNLYINRSKQIQFKKSSRITD
jgi:CubicO group peptidase (beta-lactamase class C family)